MLVAETEVHHPGLHPDTFIFNHLKGWDPLPLFSFGFVIDHDHCLLVLILYIGPQLSSGWAGAVIQPLNRQYAAHLYCNAGAKSGMSRAYLLKSLCYLGCSPVGPGWNISDG